MPKPLELTMDTMTSPPVPMAAQLAPELAVQKRAAKEGKDTPKAMVKEPLQVKWPGKDVKAARLAAIQMDFDSVSEFMLACFHAYMQKQLGR